MEGVDAIPVEDEEKLEEEWKRQKCSELIQYYIRRHEAFLKNANFCLDAINDLES